MVLLERLAPVERAAFLLHDVFDCAYPVVGRVLQKSEAAARQVVHRARERVRSERQRFQVAEDDRRELIDKFMTAANSGDEMTLLSLFAEDATLTSDGGGVVPAARRVVHGRRRIARLYLLLARKLRDRLTEKVMSINGEPGLVSFLDRLIEALPGASRDQVADGSLALVLADGEAADYLAGLGVEAVVIRPDRHILGVASSAPELAAVLARRPNHRRGQRAQRARNSAAVAT